MACASQCCAVFLVGGLSYDELEVRYHRVRDGDTIFDMVRPLTHEEARARAERFGIDSERGAFDKQLYRCVRWDEDTRLCTRYDERPEMCSDYPYSDSCEHCGYTEPDVTRFVWLGIRQGCGRGTWFGKPYVFGVPALTFPG